MKINSMTVIPQIHSLESNWSLRKANGQISALVIPCFVVGILCSVLGDAYGQIEGSSLSVVPSTAMAGSFQTVEFEFTVGEGGIELREASDLSCRWLMEKPNTISGANRRRITQRAWDISLRLPRMGPD